MKTLDEIGGYLALGVRLAGAFGRIAADKLEEGLRPYRFALEDVIPLFADLLSMPLQERYAPLHLSPQLRRQKTLASLVSWLLAEAERQPVLVVAEDLHDPRPG